MSTKRNIIAKRPSSRPMILDVHDVVSLLINGSINDGYPRLVTIFESSHAYLSQWKSISWEIDETNGILELIQRYELIELQLQGRSPTILLFMLQYGKQRYQQPNGFLSANIATSIIEAMLRMLLEFHIYKDCLAILQLLVEVYGVDPALIFETGCTIIDQLPLVITDANFIALFTFTNQILSTAQANGLASALKLLSYISNHVGCDWKSNFFLSRNLFLFTACLTSNNIVTSNPQELLDGLVLLRRLVNMLPQNAVDVVRASEGNVLTLLFNKLFDTSFLPSSTTNLGVYTAVQREIFLIFNICCRFPQGQQTIKTMFPLDKLTEIAERKQVLINESLVDLYFTLYEMDLEYSDETFSYVIQGNQVHMNFFHLVLTCFQTSVHNPSNIGEVEGGEFVRNIDSFARLLTKIERKVAIISNPVMFIDIKCEIMSLALSLLPEDINMWNVKHVSIIDIVCLLLRGDDRCWLPPVLDNLDEDFLNVSSTLVEQFTSITEHKLFDEKDTNTLHYLAGSDEKSPIQDILGQSQGGGSADSNDNSNNTSHDQFVENVNRRRSQSRVYSTQLSSPDTQQKSLLEDTINTEKRYFTLVQQFLQQILRTIPAVSNSDSSRWELNTTELLCRKIAYLYLLLRLFGVIALENVIADLNLLPEIIFHSLLLETHHLRSYPGMEMKCIQLIALLLGQLKNPSFEFSLQFLEYLLKIITNNPETLHERWRHDENDGRQSLSIIKRNTSSSMLNLDNRGSGRDSNHSNSHASNVQQQPYHLSMMHTAINAIVVMSEQDRSIRRKMVANCTVIIDAVHYFAPCDPIRQRPLLHLLNSFTEFASKLEVDAEEAIVTLVVRCISSPLLYVRYQTCNLIYHIGLESPGFIFRGMSRREVEDQIMDVLTHTPFEYARVIVAVIKSMATLVHNFNVKPIWLPSAVLYHWRYYHPSMQHRSIIGVHGLLLVINLLRHAQIPYRLLYFTHTLSLASSLMYACNENNGNALSPEDAYVVQTLKEFLIVNILPWLPLAMDFISLGKKKQKRTEELNTNNEALKQIDVTTRSSIHSLTPSQVIVKMLYSTQSALASFVVDFSKSLDSNTEPEIIALEDVFRPPSRSFMMERRTSLMRAASMKHNNSVGDIYKSISIEFLTAKTIDALYSFLCMDGMFPLSTYLRYLQLFERCHVIASVSYFMNEHRENFIILKRGLDLIRYFADNQMNLSGIAMHSPPALLAAVKAMRDTLEVQLSFAKIIFAVARTDDDFAKENLLRFRVHFALIEMMKAQHAELSKVSVQALLYLATSESHAKELCKDESIVDTILYLLESHPKNMRILYCGLQLLVVLEEYCPTVIQAALKKATLSATIRKSRRALKVAFSVEDRIGQNNNSSNIGKKTRVNLLRKAASSKSSSSNTSGRTKSADIIAGEEEIDKAAVEELVNAPLLKNDKCIIS